MTPSIDAGPSTERSVMQLPSEIMPRPVTGGIGRGRDGSAALNVVISEVALCHRLRGLDVQWASARCGLVARPWAVRDALHILLGNAARHDPSASVGITAERRGHWAHIAVAEPGARHGESVADRRGVRLARRLLVGVGGTLRIDTLRIDTLPVDSEGGEGARFDLRIPVVGSPGPLRQR